MTQTERYQTLEAMLNRSGSLDASYQAALYLLSSNSDLYEAAKKRIDPIGIDFAGIKRDTRSFEENDAKLIDFAHNLFSWNSKCKVTPYDISRLGYPGMELACNAIFLASGEYAVQIQAAENGSPALVLDDTQYQRTQRMHAQIAQMWERKFAEEQSEDMER